MATLSLSAPACWLTALRASLPEGTRDGATADRLCATGAGTQLHRGECLAPDPHEDRLVWMASGSAKLVAPHVTPHVTAPAAISAGQVLAFHFVGDLVSVVRQSDGDFRLVALTACDLVVFPAERFLDAAQGDPAVLRSVLTRSLQALHRSRTRMMQMGHKSAAARIADFLVAMAERLEGCTTGTCALALPMSRRDIGDSLGLTIETVSRQFAELRHAGLVVTEGRSKVCLSDVAALARIAGRQGMHVE